MDLDAVLLTTLDAREVDWSRPPRGVPIHEVVVEPKRVRRVGRVSGVIDADTNGLPGDLVARRLVHQEAERLGTVQQEARRLGPHAFSRLTGLPLRVAERASGGGAISARNVAKALRALALLEDTNLPRCAASDSTGARRRIQSSTQAGSSDLSRVVGRGSDRVGGDFIGRNLAGTGNP